MFKKLYKHKYFFFGGTDIKSVERLVLPSIIFVNTSNENFDGLQTRGFTIAIVWWNFGIGFGIFFK